MAVSRLWRISPAEVMALDLDMVGRMVALVERERKRRGKRG